jgi:AcrR family transcriptional regulator
MTVAERREHEREARRNEILDAATGVFYAKGVEAAKMRDIAAAAQLGKGTLYLYFKTKEELLLALGVRHQRALLLRWEREVDPGASGIVQLRRVMSAYAHHMSTPREHLKMVMSRWASAEPLDGDTRGGEEMRQNVQRIFGTVVATITRGQQDGTVRSDIQPAQLAIHVWSAVNGGLLLSLKLACLRDNPLASHAPSIDEHIEVVLDLARARLEQTPLPGDTTVIEEAG